MGVFSRKSIVNVDLVLGVSIDLSSTHSTVDSGFRNVDNFKCEPCSQPLRTYDYSFFVFHAIVPLFINGIFIKIYAKADQRNRHRNV